MAARCAGKAASRLAVGRAALFPLASVERTHRDRLNGAAVDAARVDAEAVGVGAWHVKRLHAASAAKQVFCDAGVERVAGERVAALEQLEAFGGYDQVQKAAGAADRTVALDNL